MQYLKPMFESCVSIRTIDNNKVYPKVEKSYSLTQMASPLKIQQDPNLPF